MGSPGPGPVASRAATAAVLLALLAGSAGWAGPQPARGIVLPFDAYRFDASDRTTIARAEGLLVTDCMRAHGFAGVTPADDSPGGPPAVPPNSRRYGVIDAGVAARYGYHFPPDPDAARRAAGHQAWLDGLPARERRTLAGPTGAGGCAAEADRHLRTGIHLVDPGWFTPLDFHSLDQSATDPRVRAATARWRACMSGRGLRYASPREAVADPRWRLNSPSPSRLEVATATADVRCKHRTRFVATWLAAERELQRTLIARRSAAFAALARGNARYLANAGTVLARHHP